MPSVEPTAFLASDTMATTMATSQWSTGATGTPMLSVPSARSPMVHSTNPPHRLRHADPEPGRARADRRALSRLWPAAAAVARARAANADDDDARPAATGKLLVLITRTAGLSGATLDTNDRTFAKSLS